MPSYPIKPLQDRIEQILCDVHESFARANLCYYMIAGTLLGAVRHKGFIPWDDDIDIAMPRKDYDRLLRTWRQTLPEHLEVVSTETDESYPLPFAKIQDNRTTLIERMHLKYLGGIYIDVFPLDGMPTSRWFQRLHFMRYEYWKRVLYLIHRDPYKHGHGPSSWLPIVCRRLYTMKQVQRKLHRLQTAHYYDTATLIVDHDDGLKGIMKKETFGQPVAYTFGQHAFNGPADAHAYLSQKYGDYMTIPKHSEQHQHNFDYLDLNRPYRQFEH